MKKILLEEAIQEAKRFLAIANEAYGRLTENDMVAHFGSMETAACRRSSMDLTRKLAELRR